MNDKLKNLQEHEENITVEETKKPKVKLTKKKKIAIAVVALMVVFLIVLLTSVLGSQDNTATGAMAGANMSSGQNNMYMEEEVILSDIVVGVTEMGSSSLISNDLSFEFQTTILEVVAKPGQFVQ